MASCGWLGHATLSNAARAMASSASQQIDAQAQALSVQASFAFRLNGLQRNSFRAKSVRVQEQLTVLWRCHQPQRENQRQRRTQRHKKRKSLGKESEKVPNQHKKSNWLARFA